MSLIERITLALADDPPDDLLPGDLVEGHEGEHREAAVLVAISDWTRRLCLELQARDALEDQEEDDERELVDA